MEDKCTQQDLWLVEWSQSKMALANCNYQDAVQLAESSLTKVLDNQVSSLLNIRSTAYEKQGLLSRALEDAIRMIQYVPTSPDGYLRAGHVYMTSGKPALAADVYRQGLEEVPNSHQLSKERNSALLQSRKRFDIIGNAPLELVHKIIMNVDCAWICLLVSQAWRERVSVCGTKWSSVIVKQKPGSTDQVVCNAVPLVSNYVEHLEIENPLLQTLNDQYLGHLKRGIFPNLTTLSLKGSFFQSITSEDLALALWQVRNTLTVLKVDFGSDQQAFSLSSILSSCPNVTELSFTTHGELCYDNSAQSTCKRLINLEIFYGNATYTALCFNLALCPNIIRLDIKSLSDRPLNYIAGSPITRYCPVLKILGLNYYGKELPTLNSFVLHGRGLLFIGIRFDQHFAFEQAIPHIEYNALHLQQLDITFAQPESTQGCHFRLNHAYPKLQTFRYRSDQYERPFPIVRTSIKMCMEYFVGGIIQNSPILNTIALFYLTPTDRSILIALESAVQRTTHTLQLNSIYFHDVTDDRYRSFFSSLDRVQTLNLMNCMFVNDNVLVSLATSLHIRQLKIAGCELLTTDGLVEFFKQVALQESHLLERVELNALAASVDLPAIRFISKIRSLSALRIVQCDMDEENIDYLVDIASFTSLKTIEILNCCHSDRLWSAAASRAEMHGIALVIK